MRIFNLIILRKSKYIDALVKSLTEAYNNGYRDGYLKGLLETIVADANKYKQDNGLPFPVKQSCITLWEKEHKEGE